MNLVKPAGSKDRVRERLEKQAERVAGWFSEAYQPHAEHHQRALRWAKYLHGDQLTSAQRAELADRYQPDLIFNRVGPSRDLVRGTEIRARTRGLYSPRGAADEERCRIATAVSHAIEDENDSPRMMSLAFADVLDAGLGWFYQGLNPSPAGPRIVEEWVPWEEVVADPNRKFMDLRDARYVFRGRWHRVEQIVSWMPQAAKKIVEAAQSSGDFAAGLVRRWASLGDESPGEWNDLYSLQMADATIRPWANHRLWLNGDRPEDPLAMVSECWYREFEHATLLRNRSTGETIEFDPDDPTDTQIRLLATGVAEPVSGPVHRIRKTLHVGPVVIYDRPSPYDHNDYPYTLCEVWRNRHERKTYSFLHRLVDAQDVVDRAFSKLFHIATTRQIWIETAAAQNIDDVAEQASMEDGVIELNPGGLERYKIEDGGDRVRQFATIMQIANDLMGENSGVNDEMAGRETNARSSVAMETRIERGATILGPLFDDYAWFKTIVGRKRLSLIRQFVDAQTQVRLTDDPAGAKYAVANERTADGKVRNDLSTLAADYVIDQTDHRSTHRRAMAETMMMIAAKLPPEYAGQVLPLAIEMSDVPRKDEWMRRLEGAAQSVAERQQAELEAQLSGRQPTMN